MDTQPKAFMSYSWSTPEHEQWVVDLAHELGDSGVHVILDKFDLREGNDAIQFMEQMVNDASVTKVLLICDQVYAEKTNARKGGVGTEAQIISPQVYAQANQNKFVAVVTERDPEGKPYVPTYYASRIYIDLGNQDTYSQEFDRLLRWIFGKPLHERRSIGNRPAFLDEGKAEVSLGTSPAFRRAIDALKGHKPSAASAITEYFDLFATNLERLRIVKDGEKQWDDQVLESLGSALPARNEVLQLLEAIAKYDTSKETSGKIHRFFESLIPYFFKPSNVNQWNDADFDNFRFLGHELFLYAIAIFIARERFDICEKLLRTQYYSEEGRQMGNEVMVDFDVFSTRVLALDMRNQRQATRYYSPFAMQMTDRLTGTGISQNKIVQAEFVAFLRSEMQAFRTQGRRMWRPDMLVFSMRIHGALEIFARAQSKEYFDRIKGMLGVVDAAEFKPLLEAYKNDQRRLPVFDYEAVNVPALAGMDKLATKA
jgi:hypothetical protein